MLRRLKKDHTDSMELPVKELRVSRQFFGEEERDFASSIMANTNRQFSTYIAQGVMLNNYANIFGLIMQMRQVADHPDLITKRSTTGGEHIIECAVCDGPAEDPIASKCHHHYCRTCARTILDQVEYPQCNRCFVPLAIDMDQAEILTVFAILSDIIDVPVNTLATALAAKVLGEGSDPKKPDEREIFADAILQGSTAQAPAIGSFKRKGGLSSASGTSLKAMEMAPLAKVPT